MNNVIALPRRRNWTKILVGAALAAIFVLGLGVVVNTLLVVLYILGMWSW